ncbi:MerR family transcriptional regulator [Metabacillus indicus]|uniref:MerR family transcriptional regulator n=1 Tax=Metabacillus indicus TaxID=246786 RepID=UPI000493503E|nr:MerR family transcriptional regulator [Metabacillus indicus]KEZ48193.1 MerR family transcriptional regulator [Metabacillus indicus LMG 22858]
MMHINKVAEKTGVTVRTLRHYDKIGLLRPASKTEGGHRLYSNTEIKKLQQIQFLKKAGFQLNEIREMLASNEWNWSVHLKSQLSFILEEIENLKKVEQSLRELIHGIAVEGEEEWIAVQKLMHVSSRDKKIQRKYRESVFREKEIQLLNKVPNMAKGDSLEWMNLIGQLKRCMKDGPGTPEVQTIIRRMDEKRIEEFDGENEFLDKLWKIRISQEQSEKMGLYPIEDDLLEFMTRAHEIYVRNENASSSRQSDE